MPSLRMSTVAIRDPSALKASTRSLHDFQSRSPVEILVHDGAAAVVGVLGVAGEHVGRQVAGVPGVRATTPTESVLVVQSQVLSRPPTSTRSVSASSADAYPLKVREATWAPLVADQTVTIVLRLLGTWW